MEGIMRRALVTAALSLIIHGSVQAQSLSDRFTQLFTFGDCGVPLCLSVNASVHGSHYNPAVTQGQLNLLSFLTNSIGNSLGNIPFTGASSGVTFSFAGGAPVRTSLSSGPIFAERSQTLGRGRLLAGLNVSSFSMNNVRGVPLNDLEFNFTHQNIQDAAMGDPLFENDIIEVNTDLGLSLMVTSAYASFGLLDNLDIGILVPFVNASLDGLSRAAVIPWSQPTPHLFGTQQNPSTTAEASSSGSASGVGDIALRAKANLFQTASWGVAALLDARLPTGDEANFLGTGSSTIRAMGVVSSRFGNLSAHANAGMAFRSGEHQNNSMLLTIGFDHLASSKVTIAGELVSGFEIGESNLVLPEPVVFTAPQVRTIDVTDIPSKSDNLLDASFGVKFVLPQDFRAVTNVLFPLSDGGLRPKFLWTLGFERTF